VLAVPGANRWPKSEPASGATQFESYAISADGRRATVTFVGSSAGSGPCDAEYSADTVESATAVAVSIRELSGSQPSNNVVCDLVGYSRTVTFDLTAALGNRVLIDATGAPIAGRSPEQ
jgi:hypothetical protein